MIMNFKHKGKEATESFKVRFNLRSAVTSFQEKKKKSVSYQGILQTSKPGQRGVKSGAVI